MKTKTKIKSPSWAKIYKNPRSWTYNYSLKVGDYIYSQHRTKKTAESAKSRLIRKHKTLESARRSMGWN